MKKQHFKTYGSIFPYYTVWETANRRRYTEFKVYFNIRFSRRFLNNSII